MKTTLSRVALASALFLQTALLPSNSLAGPILSSQITGFYTVNPPNPKALPSNIFAAQGYSVHRLTMSQIFDSLLVLSPEIGLGGPDTNQFITDTYTGAPCGNDCRLVIDIGTLQDLLGPGAQIAGIAVSMFQTGEFSGGKAKFQQGISSEIATLDFTNQNQDTLQYLGGILANPNNLSGLTAELSFKVGNSPLTQNMTGEMYYMTKDPVNAVPLPSSLSLVAVAGVAFVAVTLVSGKVILVALAAAAVGGAALAVLTNKPVRGTVKAQTRSAYDYVRSRVKSVLNRFEVKFVK